MKIQSKRFTALLLSFCMVMMYIPVAVFAAETVTYTAVQTGGTDGSADSTGIILTFSQEITGLSAENIEIQNDTGEVTKGTLSGSGSTYTIALSSVAAAGNVNVNVTDFGEFDVTTGTTVVAVYKAAAATTYTVTYNLNGGTGKIDIMGLGEVDSPALAGSYAQGEKLAPAFPAVMFQNNKQFAEWNTEADGSGTGYLSFFSENYYDTLDITMPDEPLTLYAIWLDLYILTINVYLDGNLYTNYGKIFDLEGVTITEDPISVVFTATGGTYTSETIPAGFTYDIVSFTWNNERQENWEELGSVTINEPTTVNINYYTVSFNSNGGSAVNPQIILSGKKATAPSAPSKSGYNFKGWSTNQTVYTAHNFSSTDITAATTLYAFWDRDTDNDTDNTPDLTPAPEPIPELEPTPEPAAPEENPYVLPSMDVEETESGTQYTTQSGVTSTVTLTEDEGVKVEAGVNESGSVNSQSTAAAVAEAAQIAAENGETSVEIKLPEGTKGLSKSTVQKLVEAAGDTEVVINVPTVIDGETVGSVSVPLTEQTGQILTGMTFDTNRTEQVENYVTNKWGTEVLGSFETAQKGGWGATATLSVGLDQLGFEAEEGTKLFALIYDSKNDKWYEVPAEIIDGNVVFETKRSGIITIVTDSVK